MFFSHVKKCALNGTILWAFISLISIQSKTVSSAAQFENDLQNNEICIPLLSSVFKDDIVSSLTKSKNLHLNSYQELKDFMKKINETINIVNKYATSEDEITYDRTIARDVQLYQDKSQNNWYVRPIDYRGFEQIASVVASNIHNYLAKDQDTDVLIKFLVGGTPGKRTLMGAAFKTKDFKPFWGGATDYVSYRPSNLEKEYAIWKYLGLPIPSPSFFGLDQDERKVIRVDYHDAFSEAPEEIKVNKECFKTSFFTIEEYECDVKTIENTLSQISTQKQEILQIIEECSSVLALLGIKDKDFDLSFQHIRNFIKKQ